MARAAKRIDSPDLLLCSQQQSNAALELTAMERRQSRGREKQKAASKRM